MIIVNQSPVAASQLESGFIHAGLSHTEIKATGLGSDLLGTRLGHSINLFREY